MNPANLSRCRTLSLLGCHILLVTTVLICICLRTRATRQQQTATIYYRPIVTLSIYLSSRWVKRSLRCCFFVINQIYHFSKSINFFCFTFGCPNDNIQLSRGGRGSISPNPQRTAGSFVRCVGSLRASRSAGAR